MLDTSTFYAFDPQGSVAQRLDSAGAVLQHYAFDAYGLPLPAGTGWSDPYAGFGGQWLGYADAESGLVLFGHRYYDSAAGRWVTRDPIGYAGGLNLYAYCAGDPVNAADPSGLKGLVDYAAQGAVEGAAGTFVYCGTMAILVGVGVLSAPAVAVIGTSALIIGGVSTVASLYADPSPCNWAYTAGAWGGGAAAGGAAKFALRGAEGPVRAPTYEDLLPEAQLRYPRKAGRIEAHHIDPKHMGGAKNGQTVDIDAAYHQLITNEFRRAHPYGNGQLGLADRQATMQRVYAKYPLPK